MDRTTLFSGEDEPASVTFDSNNHSACRPAHGIARWLALGAVTGPVLFTLAWLILGFMSPGFSIWGTKVSPYSPVSQSISGLGLGLTARYMNSAFVLSGLLVMAGAAGIFHSLREMGAATRWICTALLALSGLGLIVDGIFTLESIMVHTMGFLLGTGTPVVSFLVIGILLRRVPHLRQFGAWLLLASPVTLLLLVLYFATFDPVASGEGLGIAGLTQRILVVEVHAWLVALGWLAFRRWQPPSTG